MSNDPPPGARDQAPQTAVDEEAAIKAADFLLATRQREEATDRAARARHQAHADSDDEHGKELLAEMIDLQRHSRDSRS